MSKTQFLKSGTCFRPLHNDDLNLHPVLPSGNYRVCVTPQGQFYFDTVEDFDLPDKLYGDTNQHAHRILNTFMDRHGNTGVLLTGEKGSGKSLLAKKLCVDAATHGIPTIIINTPYTGEEFVALLDSVSQPCVVFLDEFEKVYAADKQDMLLTLLDGTSVSNKLFLLTCNDRCLISSFMRNRPGRIFYMLEYEGLDKNFIDEYCADKMVAPALMPELHKVAGLFSAFNFDMLKALVEEMARYGETAGEAVKLMNMKAPNDEGGTYRVKVSRDGIMAESVYPSIITGNPTSRPNGIQINGKFGKGKRKPKISKTLSDALDVFDEEDFESGENFQVSFSIQHLSRLDATTGVWTFVNGGYTLTCERQAVSKFDALAF